MRFGAFLVFAALWSVLVYAVLAHWAFGGGWLQAGGTLDFAGGVPVEMGSGFSALAAALVVGARKDYGRQALLPHNAVYVLLGAGLLWFGWFGFNGGSGFSTGNPSVLAFTNTLLCPGLHAGRLVRPRPDPRPQGDRDRRGDGDHRRLRRDHPGRRLHQPRLGDGARRPRRRCPATRSSSGARGPGSTRRSTCSPPTASPASSASSSSASSPRSPGTASPTASSTATPRSSATRRWRRWPPRPTPSSPPSCCCKLIGAVMPLRATEREEALGMDVVQHGEEAYVTGEGAILVIPEDGVPARGPGRRPGAELAVATRAACSRGRRGAG